MVELDELKKLALAATPGHWFPFGYGIWAGDEETANPNTKDHFEVCDGMTTARDRDYIAAANPATMLDLIERLERAEQKAEAGVRVGKAIFESKQYWGDRAVKAEALVTEYQKIIGGECLRLKAGDILVVRFDPRYVPTDSEQYQTLREHLYSLLPAGVHGFFLLADIGLEVLTDEQLEQAGLMRKPVPLLDEDPSTINAARRFAGQPRLPGPACPSSLHDFKTELDEFVADKLVDPFRGRTVRICADRDRDRDRECGDKIAGWCDACPKRKGGAQ